MRLIFSEDHEKKQRDFLEAERKRLDAEAARLAENSERLRELVAGGGSAIEAQQSTVLSEMQTQLSELRARQKRIDDTLAALTIGSPIQQLDRVAEKYQGEIQKARTPQEAAQWQILLREVHEQRRTEVASRRLSPPSVIAVSLGVVMIGGGAALFAMGFHEPGTAIVTGGVSMVTIGGFVRGGGGGGNKKGQ